MRLTFPSMILKRSSASFLLSTRNTSSEPALSSGFTMTFQGEGGFQSSRNAPTPSRLLAKDCLAARIPQLRTLWIKQRKRSVHCHIGAHNQRKEKPWKVILDAKKRNKKNWGKIILDATSARHCWESYLGMQKQYPWEKKNRSGRGTFT